MVSSIAESIREEKENIMDKKMEEDKLAYFSILNHMNNSNEKFSI